MPDASQLLIEKALKKLAGIEAEAGKVKAFINQICEFEGREPMFSPNEVQGSATAERGLSIAPDQFFNKPFATAVREILALRAHGAGRSNPGSIEEIHAALVEGGFNFRSNDPEMQKQGLAVSLGKNTVTFRKLPSGLFGLAEWYGAAPRTQRRRTATLRGEHVDLEGEDEGDADDENERLRKELFGPNNTGDNQKDEAAESPVSDNSAASGPTPHSADEDGREVEHDNMNP